MGSADDLSKRPQFPEDELLPWQVPESWRQVWPYGLLRGVPLYAISTMSLHSLVKWAQSNSMVPELVPIMLDILESRGGE